MSNPTKKLGKIGISQTASKAKTGPSVHPHVYTYRHNLKAALIVLEKLWNYAYITA